MNTSILAINHLTICFRQRERLIPVVNDLSFSIGKGETLALVGESGSGKSITALAIMQLLPKAAKITQGEIFFNKDNLLKRPPVYVRKLRGTHMAMIFQEALTALNPVLTIGEQIDEVLRCHLKLKRPARRQRIYDLLAEVGLKNPAQVCKSYIHQLSGGMRQRAMIAMSLAGNPDLLICDEPTTALDVTIQAQILALLKKIQRQHQMSLLFITHDLGVVANMADTVVVLRQGQMVESAPAQDFFKNPKAAYSKALFGALPSMEIEKPAQKQPQPVLLQAQSVKVHFPLKTGFLRQKRHVRAVDDVTITLHRGETFALVGESGSGKTTLGMSLLRLLTPTSGEILFNQTPLKQLRRLRHDIQLIFQDPYASLDPRMRVGDIIAEGLQAQSMLNTHHQQQQEVTRLLNLVGLTENMQLRYPHEFSGGQRQRIAIARALAVNPQFIVCDEPTSALDVSAQKQILDLLKSLQKKLNVTYLLITHNIGVVAYLADTVGVMYQGKIVEQGPVADVLTHPQHTYTKKLLSAVPRTDFNYDQA